MLEFYEKRKLKKIIYSTPSLCGIAFIIFLLGIPTFGAYQKMQSTKETKVAIAAELDELHERERVLKEEIDRLSTDRGVEDEIRRKYEVGRNGEQMIVIVGDDPEEELPPPPPPEKKGFFSSLTNWL